MEDYQKYRWFYTSSKKLVIGGKSAAQNDDLITHLKKSDKEYLIMHTVAPGSPFTCIIADVQDVSSVDKNECATFTAAFSKAWKAKAKKVNVHCFLLSQLHKEKNMKTGTWGVKGKINEIIVSDMKLVLLRQNGILRAVPASAKNTKKAIFVRPGDIDKQDILAKLEIEYNEPLSREEVLTALPAGGLSIKRK